MVLGSALFVICGIGGALVAGAAGTMYGAAIASWIGAVMFWLQLRTALREYDLPEGTRFWPSRQTGTHR
jgi:peptidoglycan biosynthesis protein MviN/MurJ (putative lipid II flippase)